MGATASKYDDLEKHDIFFLVSEVPSVFELYLLNKWANTKYSVSSPAFGRISDTKVQEYITTVLPTAKFIDVDKLEEGGDYKIRLILNTKMIHNIKYDPQTTTITGRLSNSKVDLSELVKVKIAKPPVVLYKNGNNKIQSKKLAKQHGVVHLTPKQLLNDLKQGKDGIAALAQLLLGEELAPNRLGDFIHDMNLIAKSTVFNWNGIVGVYYLVLAAIREYYASKKPVIIKAIAKKFTYKVWFDPKKKRNLSMADSCNTCYTWHFFDLYEEYQQGSLEEPESKNEKTLHLHGALSDDVAVFESSTGGSKKHFNSVDSRINETVENNIEGLADRSKDEISAMGGDINLRDEYKDQSGKEYESKKALSRSKDLEASAPNNSLSNNDLKANVSSDNGDTAKRIEDLEERLQELLKKYEQLERKARSQQSPQSNPNQQAADLETLPTLSQFDPKTGQLSGFYDDTILPTVENNVSVVGEASLTHSDQPLEDQKNEINKAEVSSTPQGGVSVKKGVDTQQKVETPQDPIQAIIDELER